MAPRLAQCVRGAIAQAPPAIHASGQFHRVETVHKRPTVSRYLIRPEWLRKKIALAPMRAVTGGTGTRTLTVYGPSALVCVPVLVPAITARGQMEDHAWPWEGGIAVAHHMATVSMTTHCSAPNRAGGS